MAISSSSRGLRPGVCTSTTRPANPYDGMVIYETDTDKVAIYDVNAWVYKTGTSHVNSALVRIDTTTVSAQNTVTLSNVFSSTYHSYMFTISNLSGSDEVIRATLGTTATGYSWAGEEWYYNATSANRRASNVAYFEVATCKPNAGSSSLFYIQNPFLSVRSTFQTMAVTTGNNPGTIQQAGFLDNATSYTNIVFTMTTSGTFSATISAYGLVNS